jgi:hypothetical protein
MGSQPLRSLDLDTGSSFVTFCDERNRPDAAIEPPYFASVTLSGGDSSWGEFLTREQAYALLGWLTTVLTTTTDSVAQRASEASSDLRPDEARAHRRSDERRTP